ncbi:ferritin-like domain-containing protein [Streptomyces sp. TP-A0356]|uniref:ferritin-like domain-containing protein n=1 Tax=Streptomyces sp. TP-A0356 TaxID=1359208 RepID=UPI0006E36D55|nr:ferritin-like domain-containing protein [Streptomyces sp. TP-A0356]
MTDSFVLDVTRIREEAQRKMEAGPVTDSYGLDKDRVMAVLNDVIATEVVCWLRYTRHAISAIGIDRAQVSAEFTEHAAAEMRHAIRAAERVSQLGGDPDFDPATLTERAHTDYTTPSREDLKAMLESNLLAERIVISTYQEIIRWLGDHDPTTRRLMESILEEEEEHADDIVDLLGV